MNTSAPSNYGEPLKQSFEKEALLSRCGNKNELVKKLLNIVLDDIPKQIEKLDQAMKEGNTEELYKVAHKIKGTSLNLGFPILKDIAEKLEKTGRVSTNPTADLQLLLDQLKKEWELLHPLLLAF
jgi:HPt (histidine-containing phosphotransfer) domain-containing protein